MRNAEDIVKSKSGRVDKRNREEERQGKVLSAEVLTRLKKKKSAKIHGRRLLYGGI